MVQTVAWLSGLPKDNTIVPLCGHDWMLTDNQPSSPLLNHKSQRKMTIKSQNVNTD